MQLRPSRSLIFLVLALQYLIVYFHRVAPAVVAPDLTTAFAISATALGLLASAYFYPYALAQVPVGILCDSWGPRKTLILFGLFSAGGSILFGIAPAFGPALCSRILVGFGVSAIFIASMKIFALWYRPQELGRISGVLMAVGGMGWLSATTPLAFLAEAFGWRVSFVAVGAAGLCLTALTWLFVVDTPREAGSVGAPPWVRPGVPARKGFRGDLTTILRERHFWAIAIWFIFRGASLFGFFGLWAGPYLVDTYGFSKYTTGNLLAMIALAMILSSPLLGYLSDNVLRSRKKVLVGTSVLNVMCWSVLALFFNTLSLPSLYGLFFLMGVTQSAVGNVAIVATKEYFPLPMAGTSMGTMNVFPFIGGILFQPLLGYVLDRTGTASGAYAPSAYRLMIIVFLLTSLFALAAILFSRETHHKEGRLR